MKRALDLIIATAALVLAMPLLVATAIAMRLTGDRGSFLFRARRVGAGGRPFTVLKIRTMRQDAPGSPLTLAHDARVTRLGRLLRRHRIDELPQLVNVIRGEMSLVGPRPEDPAYVDLTDPLHRLVFTARPGLTGLTQLAFCDEAAELVGPDADRHYREDLLPAKLRTDAEYLATRTTLLDLRILWRTARTVLA